MTINNNRIFCAHLQIFVNLFQFLNGPKFFTVLQINRFSPIYVNACWDSPSFRCTFFYLVAFVFFRTTGINKNNIFTRLLNPLVRLCQSINFHSFFREDKIDLEEMRRVQSKASPLYFPSSLVRHLISSLN